MYPFWYNFIPGIGAMALIFLVAAGYSLACSAREAFCEHFPERCRSCDATVAAR